MENNQQSFWQFSDQLRLHTANLANLSLNDSIWGSNHTSSKRPDQRTNFDVNSYLNSSSNTSNNPSSGAPLNGLGYGWRVEKSNLGNDFNDGFSYGWKMNGVNDVNGFDDGWKVNSGPIGSPSPQQNFAVNGGFNKGLYSKSYFPHSNDVNLNVKGHKNKVDDFYGAKVGKKNSNYKKNNSGENNNNVDDRETKAGTDKRYKTLPPSESLPKNETVGGYIFVCNNDTMEENLKRELFGLPPRYRDSVRQITPGLPLFLYNYSTHQLHGIFEAASFGGSNIDPTAWEDKKCPGESRFPAQVRVITRKVCEPIEEDAFRPILHHYDGPKFRLELSVPEALSLLDIFADQDSNITGIQTPIEKL
ncbi:B2 protein [Punica granatum]|uniref:DCD domain-containing protein n=2 Tax=Punica granatum TaxID=22663 RepID=A0A218WI12_PUNGR|nr:B2 protein [Punica granatum]OWM72148.1 hypothetical protein CDL15_Pgr018031 [Punica granatum]PKI77895.1 hypothetical protein CRG98_001687 [Punica granatum]